MKKLRIVTTFILCSIFLTSAISAIIIGLPLVRAETEDETYLTVDYDDLHNQTLIEDDEKKYINNTFLYGKFTPPSAQIPVFTYGCGGSLSQWSNNGKWLRKEVLGINLHTKKSH